ncbi:MAG TPA: galactose oxidase-like domain-containing protein [Actinomycetota bacterium]|nr:galactose oxidase-like domain-containing protein [Actinomycetota bacterium]
MTAIDDKYASLGGSSGFLGNPVSPEQATPDGAGRFRHYQGGSIYWHPATAAHEVHGAIRAKWQSLGWETSFLGYPLTDETTTPDGVGRFNHFQGATVGGASIYWHPSTGAHEVHGAIRGLWSSLGWETSALGYPTSDERDTPHGFARVSDFQRGSIYWDVHRGAYEVYPRPAYRPVPASIGGSWQIPSYGSGVVGMHAALLHTNKVLFFAYDEPEDHHNPGPIPPDLGESAVLDLSSHSHSTPSYSGPTGTAMPNIFCSGHALLPDGRLLVAGGDRETQSRIRSLHVFTPGGAGGSWRHVGMCAEGRWYATCVTLPDGRVLIVGGEKRIAGPGTRNTAFEIFDPASESVSSPIAQPAMSGVGSWISYPFVFVLPNGKLFVHGGTHTTFYDATSFAFTGTTAEAIARPGRNGRTYNLEGTCVLLPLRPETSPPYKAKVMMIGGGGGNPVGIRTDATNTCEIMDTSAASPSWSAAAPMAKRRVMPDSVLLPDGKVLVMNGSSRGAADNGANPVWEAELYDPATNSWRTLAPMSVPRLYHATALLLPDGRVMTAGTDSVWNPDPFHTAETRVELFSPPYLHQGPRPSITAAPETIRYGASVTVQTPQAAEIDEVVLMRCGSCTHSFNSDQRYVGLRITARTGDQVTVTAPPSAFVAPPGKYMLFVLRDGIPSVARFVTVAERLRIALPPVELFEFFLRRKVIVDPRTGAPLPFDPETCPMCSWVVVDKGEASQILVEDGRLRDLVTNGELQVLDMSGARLDREVGGGSNGAAAPLEVHSSVTDAIAKGAAVRALLLEGERVKALVLTEEEIDLAR